MAKKSKEKGYSKLSYFNKYTVTLALFVVWMLFFDRYNVYNNYLLKKGIDKLENKKQEYVEKLAQVKIEKKNFDNDIERYAREKYYMHKDNEKVFIIESNNN